MMTAHTGDPKTCPACAEIRALMRAATSFEMKELFLAMLKREQQQYHPQEKANGPR